jgi:tripartite-type tricarboxylate transporter receptor subunit TctC
MNTVYQGFEAENWYGMWFPANAPNDVVVKMNQMLVKALQDGKVREFMSKAGLEPVGSTPEELGNQVKREIAKFADVIRKGNIKLQ